MNSLKNSKSRGSISNLDYKLLEAATGNFDEDNVLGVGGFGCVYKAKLDGNCYVAVKKINGGGQEAEKEFEVLSTMYLLSLYTYSLFKMMNLELFLNVIH